MPKKILLNGVTHVFPDEFTDDQIAAALGGNESDIAWNQLLQGKGLELAKTGTIETAKKLTAIPRNVVRGLMGINASAPRALVDNPGAVGKVLAEEGPKVPERMAGAVANYASDRYGSPQRAIGTLFRDPAGAMMDVSMPLQGIGALTRNPGIVRAAKAFDPSQAVGSLVREGLTTHGNAARNFSESMMRSAAKVPWEIEKRNPGVNIPRVMIEKKIIPSFEGADEVTQMIEGLENRVGNVIDTSPARIKVRPRDMPETVGLRRKGYQAAPVDKGALAAEAKSSYNAFFENPQVGKEVPVPGTGRTRWEPNELKPRQVQDWKVRLGQMLSNKFGKDGPPMPEVEAMQAKRVDLKNILEREVPEVAELNQELGPLYAVQDVVGRRLSTFGRQNMLPMRSAIGATLFGGIWSALPQRLAGAMAGMVADNPAVLGKAAQSMDAAAQKFQALGRTAERMAKYNTLTALAENVTEHVPTGAQARRRGQDVSAAIKELQDSPGFTDLPPEEQTRQIEELKRSLAVRMGGVADYTLRRDHATPVIEQAFTARTTERP